MPNVWGISFPVSSVSIRRCFPAWHETAATELWYQALPTPLELRPWGPFHNTSTLQLSKLSNIASFVCSDITNQNKCFRMAAHFENSASVFTLFKDCRAAEKPNPNKEALPTWLRAAAAPVGRKYLTTTHELTRKLTISEPRLLIEVLF